VRSPPSSPRTGVSARPGKAAVVSRLCGCPFPAVSGRSEVGLLRRVLHVERCRAVPGDKRACEKRTCCQPSELSRMSLHLEARESVRECFFGPESRRDTHAHIVFAPQSSLGSVVNLGPQASGTDLLSAHRAELRSRARWESRAGLRSVAAKSPPVVQSLDFNLHPPRQSPKVSDDLRVSQHCRVLPCCRSRGIREDS